MNLRHSLCLKVFLFFVLALTMASATPVLAAIDVVTTTTDLQYIVQTIGGDRVKVSSIGRGHEDPHFVEAKPTFMLALGRARLLFCIGLELEIWLKPLLEGSRNIDLQVGGSGYVDCSTAVEIKEIPKTRVDASMGDVHALGNPHYWLDPLNGVHIAELAAKRLGEVDPAGQATFNKNYATFKADIEKHLPVWRAKFAALQNRKVACFHGSWVYFTDAFGLQIVGYVEPKPGVPPTGRDLAGLVGRMKAEKAHVILREQYHSDRFANMAAEKAEAEVVVLPASVGATAQITTYVSLIDAIVEQVTAALARHPS